MGTAGKLTDELDAANKKLAELKASTFNSDIQKELDMTKRMLASKEKRVELLMGTTGSLTQEVDSLQKQLEQLKSGDTFARPSRQDMTNAWILDARFRIDYDTGIDGLPASPDDFRELLKSGATDPWTDVPGLHTKYFTMTSDEQHGSGIYVFETLAALEQYMSSELFNAFGSYPHIQDLELNVYDILAGSECTVDLGSWPSGVAFHPTREDVEEAVIFYARFAVDFNSGVEGMPTTPEEFRASLVEPMSATVPWSHVPGLLSKYFTFQANTNIGTGVYIFKSAEDLDQYLKSDLLAAFKTYPHITKLHIDIYEVVGGTERTVDLKPWPQTQPPTATSSTSSARIEQLMATINEMQEDLENERRVTESTNTILANKEKRCELLMTTTSNLTAELDATNKKLDELKASMPDTDLQKELDMTKRMLTSKEKRCELLMETTGTLTEELDAANKKLSELKAPTLDSDVQKELEMTKRMLAAKEKRVELLMGTAGNLTEELDKLQQKIDEAKQDSSLTEELYDKMSQQLAVLMAWKSTTWTTQPLEFRETPASPQMLADMMRLELGREQAERKRMQQLVKTLRSENSTLQQLQAQSALPGAELQTASAREISAKFQEQQMWIQELETAKAQLEEDIRELMTTVDVLAEENRQLKSAEVSASGTESTSGSGSGSGSFGEGDEQDSAEDSLLDASRFSEDDEALKQVIEQKSKEMAALEAEVSALVTKEDFVVNSPAEALPSDPAALSDTVRGLRREVYKQALKVAASEEAMDTAIIALQASIEIEQNRKSPRKRIFSSFDPTVVSKAEALRYYSQQLESLRRQ